MPRYHVLVVDDEEAYLDAMREMLSSYGLRVSVARNASHALNLMDREPPGLFLIDIVLPDVDGPALIRQIREWPRWAKAPILVVSAKATEDDKKAALEAGATAFIAKPFTTQELRAALRPCVPATQELKKLRAGPIPWRRADNPPRNRKLLSTAPGRSGPGVVSIPPNHPSSSAG